MATITNKQLVLRGKIDRDDVISFAGADTLAQGTLMARDGADKLQPYDDDSGTASLQTPVGVLDYEVVATGAGDVACRLTVAGVVDYSKLLEDSVGGLTTKAQLDKILANTGLVPVDVEGL